MTEARLTLGRWGEEQAADYLRRRGLKIVERNYRAPVGEIDIIARQGRLLLFIEVKTRRSIAFGLPQEAVGKTKQRQIVRTAQWYLGHMGAKGLQPRFDVLTVRPDAQGGAVIEHIPDAFGL